ncbi:LysR family transcriptional regulator [Solirhodobacter olei]|uniref:LysR family transcriptional regulator n=1 Tax=Solirhodobacter olei TaxID=2493082 RepID=UPI000FDBE17B|nr:LysR family transcriptional regulator [Solirhodobacter olei]
MAVTFRQLQYFLALAEELHFGRAAERLHISQPPLSASLKQLEHSLGFELMLRSNRMVRLTPAGAVFAEHARRILGQLGAAEAIAAQTAKGFVGTVKVAFVPSVLFNRLPPALKAFQEAYPEIELNLREMNTAQQVNDMMHHKIDVGFVHEVPLPEEIKQHKIETERLVCCLPRGHRLSGRTRIRLSELAGERVIVFSRELSANFYDRIAALLRAAEIEPYPHYHMQHWFTVVALVAQGMGVSLVPKSLATGNFANVTYVEIAERNAERQILLICRRDAAAETAKLFAQFVVSGNW